ncbi:hydrogen peroxide-inducible genes activator [Corynebacterium alimapuense]|uniref:Probable hydrogen peroxide-inducible genes activator n=1 Tax=Corynebacterium alimapuense TaxID=1576874 RepID=A0A3M8K834_9CORY|nr:hydrogen peroxide-inducible genes activator [Corynebacterium alimapuense]RNE49320.1 LysR family transcriptional regulator [Corynebacterium alimapuense]
MSNKEYRPTLSQLRTFVTIAENKHFGTAAHKLAISQPSLSQALMALEQGLGLQLIERSTRRVIVTTAGEKLLPYAKATLDAADIFLTHARGTHGDFTGPLTIGIIPTISPYLLPNLLTSLHEKFPELEPRIIEDQTDHLIQMLRDGQIDLAVMALPSEAPGVTEISLYQEKFSVVVPQGHHLAGRNDLGLDCLEDLDLLLLDDGHCLRDQIVDLCRTAELNPTETTNSITRASSLTTIIQLVAGGLGSTLIPKSAVNSECARPGLATASFRPGISAQREVGLVFRNSSSRAGEFAAFGELVTAAYLKAISAQ